MQVDHAQGRLDHLAAVVGLGNDAIGTMPLIGRDRDAGPCASLPATMIPVSSGSSPELTAGAALDALWPEPLPSGKPSGAPDRIGHAYQRAPVSGGRNSM